MTMVLLLLLLLTAWQDLCFNATDLFFRQHNTANVAQS